jgi:hypothetical protein
LFMESCASCHSFQGAGGKNAPDLTDYGSQEWIRGMIINPSHSSRYGKKNEMTSFHGEGLGEDILLREFLELQENNDAKANLKELSASDREIIIRWLTRDYRVVFGGKDVVP